MGKCIIFCAGEFSELLAPVQAEDCIIAADGGLIHTTALGLTPNIILGDFDSLGYTPDGSEVFPVEKDDTDAMLAVKKALRLGFREILLYGSLEGPRLDHTVANLQTLQYAADHGAVGYLIGKRDIVTTVQNASVSFPATAQGILSVFCLGRDATGVTITGLKYTAQNVTLTAGFPLGVSNYFAGKAAEISVSNGCLTLIYGRENGFPQREVLL